MNRVTYIGWLAGEAAGGLTYLWPVTLALVCLVIGAAFRDCSKARLRFGPRFLYLFLPAVDTLLILVLGTLFERQPSVAYLPSVGFGIAALLAVVPAIVLKSAWLTSVSTSLCLLWYSFWCKRQVKHRLTVIEKGEEGNKTGGRALVGFLTGGGFPGLGPCLRLSPE